jgi:hypothetical protein
MTPIPVAASSEKKKKWLRKLSWGGGVVVSDVPRLGKDSLFLKLLAGKRKLADIKPSEHSALTGPE